MICFQGSRKTRAHCDKTSSPVIARSHPPLSLRGVMRRSNLQDRRAPLCSARDDILVDSHSLPYSLFFDSNRHQNKAALIVYC
jgi:hypothetical protein